MNYIIFVNSISKTLFFFLDLLVRHGKAYCCNRNENSNLLDQNTVDSSSRTIRSKTETTFFLPLITGTSFGKRTTPLTIEICMHAFPLFFSFTSFFFLFPFLKEKNVLVNRFSFDTHPKTSFSW